MIPKTLSASSLQVAALCMDRWKAEYLDRGNAPDNPAALIGTACHYALEKFVEHYFILKKNPEHHGGNRAEQAENLLNFYKQGYMLTFGSADFSTEEYEDGLRLVKRWLDRNDLDIKRMIGVESTEKKESVDIPYGPPNPQTGERATIPFNYIMDRVDQIDETVWEVVDYKSVRVPIQPQDLEHKIQARAYSLAIQIKHPEATKIIVTFDLLRHEPVSIVFNRDDNIKFWHFLVRETQRIVDLQEEDIRPNLNSDCGFCIKKFSCELLQSNIEPGGINSLSIDQSVNLIQKLKDQSKANTRIIAELEERVLRWAASNDSLEWVTSNDAYDVEVGVSRRRTFPANRAADIMGPELFATMGSMTLGNLEKIIRDESLDPRMRQELEDLISWTNGNVNLKIKPKAKGL